MSGMLQKLVLVVAIKEAVWVEVPAALGVWGSLIRSIGESLGLSCWDH